MVLSGRNILALEAARHNYSRFTHKPCLIVPAADLILGTAALNSAAAHTSGNTKSFYGLIIAFPQLLPQSSLSQDADQYTSLWDGASSLLCPGGIFIAAFSSTDAERFDRKKPSAFTRLGDIKREGFRALGYKMETRQQGSGVEAEVQDLAL